MNEYPPAISDQSQLFTVRVWAESSQDGSRLIRVQVKHVLSGATRTYREWSQVIAFIEARLWDNTKPPPANADLR